jgi:predicted Kef-type K+ transport protein
VIYFGIACSLSSRQLMKEHLEHHHQTKTMHGRLLQGIALYQDIFAMMAMTIIQAFKATMIDLDKVSAMANSTVPIQAETLSQQKHRKTENQK